MIDMGLHPFDEVRFRHELAPADLQGWEVRLAHQRIGTGFGDAQSALSFLETMSLAKAAPYDLDNEIHGVRKDLKK